MVFFPLFVEDQDGGTAFAVYRRRTQRLPGQTQITQRFWMFLLTYYSSLLVLWHLIAH